MVEYILFGGGLAFAFAVQPGPLQAYFLSTVAQKGWRRTLPAALAPLLSDGPVAIVSLLVLDRIPDVVSRGLRAAGGILLLVLAWRAYRQWRRPSQADATTSASAPRTLLQAAMVNLLNPGPWLGWTLVLGPAFLEAWRSTPANAVALLVAFYATMVMAMAGTILLFGTSRFLGPGARRALVLISALALAALGVYQLVISIAGVGAA